MTSALSDSDIQEAIRCWRSASDSDIVLARMASATMQIDAALSRFFISEIRDPDLKTPSLLELCLTTFDPADVQKMKLVARSCQESPEDWHTICEAIRYVVNEQLPLAREACQDIQDLLLLIKLQIFFARRTKLPEDTLLLNVSSAELEKRMRGDDVGVLLETIGSEFLFIAKSDLPYWVARLEWMKRSRKARLGRLIKLQAPSIVISEEICMIAETGEMAFALQAAKQNKITLDMESDSYCHNFSIGYSRQGQASKARELAEKIRDPDKRALAFVHLYLVRRNN